MTTLVKAKVSTVVSQQVPEFVREDHQTFVAFLQAYYDWMEQVYKPGYMIRNMDSFRDIDTTLDEYVKYIKNEVMASLPEDILVNKRFLAKHIYELYRTKGTVGSYELLFRILFNETPELYFPKLDMLRVSDGKWDSRTIIRCVEVSGDAFNIVGQTITQPNDSVNELLDDPDDPAIELATAKVESVIKFAVGDKLVSELTLNDDSIIGNFVAGQIISAVDTTNPNRTVSLRILTIVSSFDIVDGGKYYTLGQPVTIALGSGRNAAAQIGGIKAGPITGVVVDDPGTGYNVGDRISFDNTNTNGRGAEAIVTSIDTNYIALEELELGTLDSTDVTFDTAGTLDAEYFTETETEYLLTELGDRIILEGENTGGIKTVQILNGGSKYESLPLPIPPNTGSGAKLLAVSEDIGRVTKIDIIDFGADYESPPIAITPVNVVIKDRVGSFLSGERLIADPDVLLKENGEDRIQLEDGSLMLLEYQSTPTGTYFSLDADRNLLTVFPASERLVLTKESGGALLTEEELFLVTEESGEFGAQQTIRGVISGASARNVSMEHCHLQAVSGSVGTTIGSFVNADGKVSESSKRIQDSRFYQDYSYVIKVGQSIDRYRDIVKKVLHPIGLALFGEVRIQSFAETGIDLRSNIVDLSRVVLLLLDLKIKSFDQKIVITIQDFVELALNVKIQSSDFYPTIIFPRVTPSEVHLLELGPDLAGTFPTINIHTLFGEVNVGTDASAYHELELDTLTGDASGAHTLAWLDKYKFFFPPYVAGTKTVGYNTPAWNQTYEVPNENYWSNSSLGNTQIKDFANITVYDVINNPDRKIFFTLDSYVDVIVLPRRMDLVDVGSTFDRTDITMDFTTENSMDQTIYSMDSTQLGFDNG